MAATDRLAQLPLRLSLRDEATLENFLTGPASAPLCELLALPPREPLLFLHGPAAAGKSHLLQAACHLAQPGSLYLPLAGLESAPAEDLLAELEGQRRLAIDDLQAVAGHASWEEALFHLVNRCRDSGCQLVFASRLPPGELPVALPDLRSRLAGGVTWALPGSDEVTRRAILAFRAGRRGLGLSPAVLDYLCSRASRSLPDLLAVLDRLDEVSLQAQRPITVPLVREAMGW
jgi:DnaA family protein